MAAKKSNRGFIWPDDYPTTPSVNRKISVAPYIKNVILQAGVQICLRRMLRSLAKLAVKRRL
jgi:hypothetical protein